MKPVVPPAPYAYPPSVSGVPRPDDRPGGELERIDASGEIAAEEFTAAFGEPLKRALDLDTWTQGGDLSAVLAGLDAEVAAAVQAEDEYRRHIRERILPMIGGDPGAPACAGVYKTTTAQIQQTQTHVLFNGGVEACDGTASIHDTLPLTIMQIGICLVSYAGEQGAYVHRLYRRDLRARSKDPFEDLLAMLGRRSSRSGLGQPDKRDGLSELARRGIMAYAERAVLLQKGTAPWRMGHGNPAPYELLTGSGSMDLLARGLDVIEELVLGHKRFVYVPSAPGERGLLTIGNALRPLEFAIVDTAETRMYPIIFRGTPARQAPHARGAVLRQRRAEHRRRRLPHVAHGPRAGVLCARGPRGGGGARRYGRQRPAGAPRVPDPDRHRGQRLSEHFRHRRLHVHDPVHLRGER